MVPLSFLPMLCTMYVYKSTTNECLCIRNGFPHETAYVLSECFVIVAGLPLIFHYTPSSCVVIHTRTDIDTYALVRARSYTHDRAFSVLGIRFWGRSIRLCIQPHLDCWINRRLNLRQANAIPLVCRSIRGASLIQPRVISVTADCVARAFKNWVFYTWISFESLEYH